MRREVVLTTATLCATLAVASFALPDDRTPHDPARARADAWKRTSPRIEVWEERVARVAPDLHRRSAEPPPPVASSRAVEIRVLDDSGRAVSNAPLVIERRLPHGAWVHLREMRTDGSGSATAHLPAHSALLRARTAGSRVSEIVHPHVPITSIRVPDASRVELLLVDARSTPIPGARSVCIDAGGTSYVGRTSDHEDSRWSFDVRCELPHTARVRVADSLGQVWQRTIELQPTGAHRVTPNTGLTLLRSDRLALHTAMRARSTSDIRMRWSLTTAGGGQRQGAVWSHGSRFHAVTRSSAPAAAQARLELIAESSDSHPMRQVVHWPLATSCQDITDCNSRVSFR